MIDKELQLVSDLTNVAKDSIKFSDNGFLSRAYIIDDGRIVFKFKKWPEISYKNEAKALNFLESTSHIVELQKVNWISKNDNFLGVYGVIGNSLEEIIIPKEKYKNYGSQIGHFLAELHKMNPDGFSTLTVEQEISIWQTKFERSKEILKDYFTEKEIKKMSGFVYLELPNKLLSLGKKMAFSHGDIREANIFVNEKGKIGVIDFSEAAYQDEAADFMDMEDDALREEVLNSYGADDILKQKIRLRRIVHPMFIIGAYKDRPKKQILQFVKKLKDYVSNL